jgi:hypothetical protein
VSLFVQVTVSPLATVACAGSKPEDVIEIASAAWAGAATPGSG